MRHILSVTALALLALGSCPAWAQAEVAAASGATAATQAPSLVRVMHGELRTRDARGAWVRTALDIHTQPGQIRFTPVVPMTLGVLGPVASVLAKAGDAKVLLVAPGQGRGLAIGPATLERLTEQRGLATLAQLLAKSWATPEAKALPKALVAAMEVPGWESPSRYGAWRFWRGQDDAFPRKAEYEDAGKVTLIWEAKRIGGEPWAASTFQAPAQVVDAEGALGL